MRITAFLGRALCWGCVRLRVLGAEVVALAPGGSDLSPRRCTQVVQGERPAVHGERVVGSVAQGSVQMPMFGSQTQSGGCA